MESLRCVCLYFSSAVVYGSVDAKCGAQRRAVCNRRVQIGDVYAIGDGADVASMSVTIAGRLPVLTVVGPILRGGKGRKAGFSCGRMAEGREDVCPIHCLTSIK